MEKVGEKEEERTVYVFDVLVDDPDTGMKKPLEMYVPTRVLSRRVQTLEDVVKEFLEEIGELEYDIDSIKNSLRRINIDTATFTVDRITMAEIFQKVWNRITSKDSGKRENWQNQLVTIMIIVP